MSNTAIIQVNESSIAIWILMDCRVQLSKIITSPFIGASSALSNCCFIVLTTLSAAPRLGEDRSYFVLNQPIQSTWGILDSNINKFERRNSIFWEKFSSLMHHVLVLVFLFPLLGGLICNAERHAIACCSAGRLFDGTRIYLEFRALPSNSFFP